METQKYSTNEEEQEQQNKYRRLRELVKRIEKHGVPLFTVGRYIGQNALLPNIEKITNSVNPKYMCLNKYILKDPEFFTQEMTGNCHLSRCQRIISTDENKDDDDKLIVPKRKLRSIMRPSETWLQQDIIIENTNGVLTEDIWTHLLETNKRADGTINIGTSIFKVHMVCLRIYAKYFLNYPYTVEFQFDPDLVPPEGFQAAYDWMRLNEYYLDASDIVNVLQVAIQLKIKELEKDLWRILMDNVFYDEYAYYIFNQALEFETLKPLCHLMLGRLHRYLLLLVSKKNFYMVDAELMETMISSDYCGINSEVEIFYILLFWINSDFKKNNLYMEKLIKYVRFGYMPTPFLENLLDGFKDDCNIMNNKISRLNNRALLIFFKGKNTAKLLNDAVSFATYRLVCGKEELIQQCKRGNICYYNRRYYISDPFCPYHKKNMETSDKQYPMYDDFIKYLERMESRSDKYPLHMRSTLDDKFLKPTQGMVNMAVKKPKFAVKKVEIDIFKKEIIS